MPEAAFLICRFWLIDAWWWLGRREEARELFVDALGYRNRYGLLAEDIHPQTGAAVGQFPPDLFHGRTDPDGDASVAKLGGSILARLILVSNRVASSQRWRSRAGGLEVVLGRCSSNMAGVWFGWSGDVVPRDKVKTQAIESEGAPYVVTDLSEEDYRGILQWLRQPRAVADPPLPPRPGGVQSAATSPAICASTSISPTSCQDPPARRYRLGSRLSSDPDGRGAAPTRVTTIASASSCMCRFPRRKSTTVLPHHERLLSAAPAIRPGGLSDGKRRPQFRSLCDLGESGIDEATLPSHRPAICAEPW